VTNEIRMAEMRQVYLIQCHKSGWNSGGDAAVDPKSLVRARGGCEQKKIEIFT